MHATMQRSQMPRHEADPDGVRRTRSMDVNSWRELCDEMISRRVEVYVPDMECWLSGEVSGDILVDHQLPPHPILSESLPYTLSVPTFQFIPVD